MFKNLKMSSLALSSVAILIAGNVQASLLIDDFNTTQILSAGISSSTIPLVNPNSDIATDFSATGLTNADRTITNTVFGSTELAEIETIVNNGVLSISANALSQGGKSSLLYNGFAVTDFSAQGSSILLEVLDIDTGVFVEMIINGGTSTAATSGQKAFTSAGEFFVEFSDFTPDGSSFTEVSSIELIFSGTQKWDGTFRFLRTDNPPTESVPTPGTIALLGLGLIGLARGRKPKA